MGPEQAEETEKPLLEVLNLAGSSIPESAFAMIAIVAITNTALANSIMASRLLYGMANQGLLPQQLSVVHSSRRTPVLTIIITALLTLLLVSTGSVTVLAQTTGAVLVLVFTGVHISLIRVRKLGVGGPSGFKVPVIVPYVGATLTAALLFSFPGEVCRRLGIIMAVIIFLYLMLVHTCVHQDRA